MGRTGPEFGSWMWAACGLVNLAAAETEAEAGGGGLFSLLRGRFEEEELVGVCVPLRRPDKVGMNWVFGEFLRRSAPGQPHSGRSGSRVVESGEE